VSKKSVLYIKFCAYCGNFFFNEIEHDLKLEDIDSLVEAAEVKFIVCKECTYKIKEAAKEVLKEAFKDEEELKNQFSKRNPFKIIK